MNKFVITFAKEGYIKYISHLDTVRLFERGFKRGNIKIQYSQGFNPHPKMVFAQPLSLGYTAENEKLEIETKLSYEADEIKKILENIMPVGLVIKKVEAMTEKTKSLAALTVAAEYTIFFSPEIDFRNNDIKNAHNLYDLCESFMQEEEINAFKVQKKTGKTKVINIRPMIKTLSAENESTIRVIVSQGSDENLSPELLIDAFFEYCKVPFLREQIDVTRNRLIQK